MSGRGFCYHLSLVVTVIVVITRLGMMIQKRVMMRMVTVITMQSAAHVMINEGSKP